MKYSSFCVTRLLRPNWTSISQRLFKPKARLKHPSECGWTPTGTLPSPVSWNTQLSVHPSFSLGSSSHPPLTQQRKTSRIFLLLLLLFLPPFVRNGIILTLRWRRQMFDHGNFKKRNNICCIFLWQMIFIIALIDDFTFLFIHSGNNTYIHNLNWDTKCLFLCSHHECHSHFSVFAFCWMSVHMRFTYTYINFTYTIPACRSQVLHDSKPDLGIKPWKLQTQTPCNFNWSLNAATEQNSWTYRLKCLIIRRRLMTEGWRSVWWMNASGFWKEQSIREQKLITDLNNHWSIWMYVSFEEMCAFSSKILIVDSSQVVKIINVVTSNLVVWICCVGFTS